MTGTPRRLPIAQAVAVTAAGLTARTVLVSRQVRPAFWAGLATYLVVHRAIRPTN